MFNKYIDKYLLNKELYNKQITLVSVPVVITLVLFYGIFLSAPRYYPIGSVYNLKSGQTLSAVSDDFLNDRIVRSEFWFKAFVEVFSFGRSKILQGDYALNRRENSIIMAWRITHGGYEVVPLRVTIPEGLNSFEIADILSSNLPAFNKEVFLDLVKKDNLEGYLFPDTYLIMPNAKEENIIKVMNDNFDDQIKSLLPNIKTFGKSLSDVIKMASILEEEARLYQSRQIIAGILWKRIDLHMALQVDSSFKYINGKTTLNLTLDDLKVNSPYNSYTHTGLPPTPISNPGIEAIKAAINPIKTPYLYFLTDRDGNMHYASTFDEHVANKAKYLR